MMRMVTPFDVWRRWETIWTQPRDIEFTTVFPNESDAKRFAQHFRAIGYSASIEGTGTVENLPWDVIVVRHMVPQQESLQQVASTFGGRIDGWGCLSGRSSDPSG